jgi:urea transport system substrate-binding protein
VREQLESGTISYAGPGGLNTMNKNHHTTKNVYIGETKANGQFKILKTFDQVAGDPFLLQGLDDKLAAMSK